jgi:hypothetical protein
MWDVLKRNLVIYYSFSQTDSRMDGCVLTQKDRFLMLDGKQRKKISSSKNHWKMCCFLKMGNVAMKEIHLSKLVLFCTEIRFCFYIKYKFGFTLNSLSSTLYNTYLIFAFLILYCEYRYTYPTARRSPKQMVVMGKDGMVYVK